MPDTHQGYAYPGRASNIQQQPLTPDAPGC